MKITIQNSRLDGLGGEFIDNRYNSFFICAEWRDRLGLPNPCKSFLADVRRNPPKKKGFIKIRPNGTGWMLVGGRDVAVTEDLRKFVSRKFRRPIWVKIHSN